MPKEEHTRQAQIYLWGLEKYFNGQFPLNGAIIYYENRDTLDHVSYEVPPDPDGIAELMERVQKMLDQLDGESLTDRLSPRRSLGHRYCPYLEICEPGQRAMEWQAKQPRDLPDEVLANMIANDHCQEGRGKDDRKEAEERATLARRAGAGTGVGMRR